MFFWLLFPAITMSLGWGLRGYIGGGPLGAMIPGALAGLALCLLLRRDAHSSAVIAALAAVGVGFGGQMTYGQTIGLAVAESTRAWGLLGLTVKGGLWGLLGGAVIGLALERQRVSLAGLAALVAGTLAGYWFLNGPHLIYFSSGRVEMWAGMLAGALALLLVERSALAWKFALIATAGGAFGFGVGGWIQVWGRWNAPHAFVGWWKVMEFFFGFCFGAALGYAAWRWRVAAPPAAPRPATFAEQGLALLPVLAALPFEYMGPLRCGYTVAGSVLIAFVSLEPFAAGTVAITMTFAAFCYDLSRVWWVAPAAALALNPLLYRGFFTTRRMFLLLMWTANAIAMAKAFRAGHLAGEYVLFIVLGIAAHLLLNRLAQYERS